MGDRNNTAVLIPAYNPSETMLEIVKDLTGQGFLVVVVNDGSDGMYDKLFEQAGKMAHVITHERNRGKGIALKTGIDYIASSQLRVDGFITADADGQHSVKDIIRVADALEETDGIVLGVRHLGKDIPIKSKIGNDLSKWVFAIVTGTYLEDNQSGLRGFPIELCGWLLSVPGTYYEYEMNMLSGAVKKGISIHKLPIETIYLDNNSETHFKPVLDTIRIQKSLIKKGLVSILLYVLSITALIFGMSFSGRMIDKLPDGIRSMHMIGGVHGSVILLCMVVAVIYIIHLFSIGKSINLNKSIFILFKYIIITILLILSAGSCLLTTLSVVALIILLPVITYAVTNHKQT